MKPSITTVVLDFGGVLGLPQDPARAATMASLCGLSVEKFMLVYRRDRLELDRGTLAADEYWKRILAEGGIEPQNGLIARIEREDALGWTRINQPVVDWSAELRSAGFRTAILSNMPVEKLSFIRVSGRFAWMDDFELTLFSCDYRLVKPEPGFYRLLLERMRVAPSECVFLDDSTENADGARALGINALVFRSAREAAVELERRWGLPVQKLREAVHGQTE